MFELRDDDEADHFGIVKRNDEVCRVLGDWWRAQRRVGNESGQ